MFNAIENATINTAEKLGAQANYLSRMGTFRAYVCDVYQKSGMGAFPVIARARALRAPKTS